MSLFKYDNYDRPFAGFGAISASEYDPPPPSSQDRWIRRYWPVVLEILGYISLGAAAIGRAAAVEKAKKAVDAYVPKGEIKQNDFELMVRRVMQLDPKMSRAEAEKRICEVFGNRIPACYGRKTTDTEGLPSWVIYAGLGLVGLMLLRK